jgi:hypothetical protein
MTYVFPSVVMAAKKKVKGVKGAAKATKKKSLKKAPMMGKPSLKVKKQTIAIGGKKIKCCSHCPDFEYCEDKGVCCDYCDFYLNGKCTFGKKKGIPSVNQEVELPSYRGDDYGIDDYEAYEPVYE